MLLQIICKIKKKNVPHHQSVNLQKKFTYIDVAILLWFLVIDYVNKFVVANYLFSFSWQRKVFVEGMFSPLSICLFIYAKTTGWISTKLGGYIGYDPRTN